MNLETQDIEQINAIAEGLCGLIKKHGADDVWPVLMGCVFEKMIPPEFANRSEEEKAQLYMHAMKFAGGHVIEGIQMAGEVLHGAIFPNGHEPKVEDFPTEI